jgi:hypothetical protein
MNNPQFTNVNITFSTVNSSFQPGETIYSFTSTQLNSNVTVTSGQTNVSCNNANFNNQLVANQYIYITGTETQLSQVDSIASNGTQLVIDSASLFSCTQSLMYSITLTGNAVVSNASSNSIFVNNCTPTFVTGTTVIGSVSGTTGTVSTIVRNGIAETFEAFIELYKYSATMISGQFSQDEQVFQGNNTAYLFAATGSSGAITVYLSNFTGDSFSNGTMMGTNQ